MIDKKVEYGKFAGILGGIFLAVSFIFFRILTPGSYIPVITLILAILGLLIYLLLSFSSLQITFARKGVQRGILSLLRLVITGGILITVYILFKSYLNYSKDMTQDSLFTLSQQSKSVVESLSNPVQITVWSSEEMTGQFDRQTSLTTLLKFYQQASPKIQVRYLEPNLHPTIFRAYNLIPRQDIGSIVVRRLKLPKQIAAGHFEANILLRLKQQQNAPSDIQGDQKKGPLPSMSFKSDINDNLSLLQKAYSKSGNKYLLNSEVDKDLTKVKEIAGIFESVGYQFSNYMVIRQRDLYHGKNYQGESKITSAISNLEGSNNKVIYVTTGHGEKTFDLHYSVMKNSLSLESYIVKPITLTNQIPGDCDVLLMPGPTRPFLDSELNIINDYLKKGGKAMIMIDPAFEYARAGQTSSVNIHNLLKEWHIRVSGGFVYDPTLSTKQLVQVDGGFALIRILQSVYGQHFIVDKLKQSNINTIFLGIRGIEPITQKKPSEDLKVSTLLTTSQNGWSELAGAHDRVDQQFDQGTDIKGPITYGLSVSKKLASKKPADTAKPQAPQTQKETRLVVFGDSDFITNNFTSQHFGRDLFINSLNWLTSQEKKITIRPKERKSRVIMLTSQGKNLIYYFSVYILPFSIVGLGVLVYIRRRKRR